MIDFTIYKKYYRHQREYVKDFLVDNPRPLGTKARAFAEKIHNGQFRKDGTPYMVHPDELVYYMILIGFDDDLAIGAGYPHDGPEDDRTTHEDVEEELGKAVSSLVRLLTNPKSGMTEDEFKKHLMCIFEDIRTLVAKIIDRVANMKRSMIGYFNKKSLTRYCNEAENVMVPMLEGFIAVIENPGLLDPMYSKMYGEYAKSLRILRSFLKGFLQAGREHIKLMDENEKLEGRVYKLLARNGALDWKNKELRSEIKKLQEKNAKPAAK